MTDSFTRALLAALNESAEVKESDWNSIAELLRDPPEAQPQASETEPVSSENRFVASENRFAETVSYFMAKVRAVSGTS